MDNPEENDGYVPVEKVSFSFVFFLVSGATLLVTLWAFWDDEYSRRGFKAHQEEYFKAQYARAEGDWKKINDEISSRDPEIPRRHQRGHCARCTGCYTTQLDVQNHFVRL